MGPVDRRRFLVAGSAAGLTGLLGTGVAMMTGVLPRRSGVPANQVYDRVERTVRDLDRPADLRGPTLLDRLRTEQGRVTASVLSKDYLFGIFRGRASQHWNPQPRLPITDHAPDLVTMTTAIDYDTRFDPALLFVNLGDVDRVGTPTSPAPRSRPRDGPPSWPPTPSWRASRPTCAVPGGGSARSGSCWPTTRWTSRCRPT